MAGNSFLPDKDTALLAWSGNFSTLLSATPTVFGITAPAALAYAGLHTAFANTMAGIEPGVRTKASVLAKNAARAALKNSARLLAKVIEGTPTVTNAQKATLGLNVRAIPTPIPAPASAPGVDIVSTFGRTVRVRLHDSAVTSRRGRPANTSGAAVFSFVGPTPPATAAEWRFEGTTSKTLMDIVFDDSVPNGSVVWFTANWIGTKMVAGPKTTPVSANLPGGAAMAA